MSRWVKQWMERRRKARQRRLEAEFLSGSRLYAARKWLGKLPAMLLVVALAGGCADAQKRPVHTSGAAGVQQPAHVQSDSGMPWWMWLSLMNRPSQPVIVHQPPAAVVPHAPAVRPYPEPPRHALRPSTPRPYVAPRQAPRPSYRSSRPSYSRPSFGVRRR